MDPALATLIGGLASASTNFAGGIITNVENRDAQREAFIANQAQIRKQNAYNSPAQQVLRLKQAGLSPAIAYGDGQVVSSTQNDVATMEAPPNSAPSFNFGGAISPWLDVREQGNRDTLALKMALKYDTEIRANTFAADISEQTLKEMLDTYPIRFSKLQRESENLYKQGLQLDQVIENLKKDYDIKDATLTNLDVERRLGEEKIKQTAMATGLDAARIYEIYALVPHKCALMDAQQMDAYVRSKEGLKTIEAMSVAIGTAKLEQYDKALEVARHHNSFDVDSAKDRTVGLKLLGRETSFTLNQKGWEANFFDGETMLRQIAGTNN